MLRRIRRCRSTSLWMLVTIFTNVGASGTRQSLWFHVASSVPRAAHLHQLLQLRAGAVLSQDDNTAAAAAAAAVSSSTTKKKSKRKAKGTSSSSTAGKKKKTNKQPDKPKQQLDDTKARISKTLHEKDAAEALGDAIRERADQLRYDITTSPILDDLEQSVTSLGWALGASDQRMRLQQQQDEEHGDDGAGVEVAPTSILVNYCLKSHGGAHILQCVCSLLATAAGLGAMMLPLVSGNSKTAWQNALSLSLIRRCMLFAMVKHVSGLLAATFLTARAIPQVGLRKARVWMEELVKEPVSQYVFYAACILVWMPNPVGVSKVVAVAAVDSAAAAAAATVWWQSYPVVPFLLVGPVVLRELVSTALVISDLLVLWNFSTRTTGGDGRQHPVSNFILQTGQTVTNAVMSVLVTPAIWRSARAAERQAILAKLVSKVTLALEVAVGLLLMADAIITLVGFTFAPSLSQRNVSVLELLKRLFCTRLYWHFLWTRKRKIGRLANSVRGGASQWPLYVLQVLIDPVKSMGLDQPQHHAGDNGSSSRVAASQPTCASRTNKSSMTWKDYLMIMVGLDSDDKGSSSQ